jgi:channel protein (hemolysin III family)
MDVYPIRGFSEPFSCFTHLFSTGVFLVWGWFLLHRGRGSLSRLLSLGVFVFATLFMLSMSGVYHLFSPGGAGRAVLARLDQAAIFVLIAGTFTPIHTILFQGVWRWGMLLVVWCAAITAITLKSIYFDDVSETLSLGLYLGLGWVGVVSGLALYRRLGLNFVLPLLWEGSRIQSEPF